MSLNRLALWLIFVNVMFGLAALGILMLGGNEIHIAYTFGVALISMAWIAHRADVLY